MYDVIVIGGGPSGMMASITASKRGFKVLLLEKNKNLGKKLLMTGGTRCNVTNLVDIDKFISNIPVNKDKIMPSLKSFTPHDIYNYFISCGLKLKVEDDNRVFPSDNMASSILDVLYDDLIRYKTEIHYNEEVLEIKEGFVKTNKEEYKCKNIIVATGGMSYPHTGSSGDNFKFAKSLDVKTTPVYPSNTQVYTKEKFNLAGLSFDNVELYHEDKIKTGSLLFTHKGLSGPAIFKVSEHIYLGDKKLYINFLPNIDLASHIKISNPKKEIKTVLKDLLPKRFVDFVFEYFNIDGSIFITSLGNKNIEKLSKINHFEVNITGMPDVITSYVTGGGISFDEVNPNTLELINHKGIYFIGEALDVHGYTGGYNITIALSTGHLAATSLKK